MSKNEDNQISLNVNPKFKQNYSNSLFSKMTMNLSNMLGPAVICLPFVMQKSGIIPTIITLLFLCLFSTFASLCLTETLKLINVIKMTNFRKFEYNNLIDTLIKDPIFAYSSKFCVMINHLLYTILCIITLSKTFTIFILDKYQLFSKLILTDENKLTHYDNFFFNFGNSILNNEDVMIIMILFIIFLFLFFICKFNQIKRIFNYTIFGMLILVLSGLVIYLAKIHSKNKVDKINHNMANLIGVDFTYLYGTILFSFSFVSAFPSWNIEEENLNNNNSTYTQKKALQYSAFLAILFKLSFSIVFSYLIKFGTDFSMKDYLINYDNSMIYSYLILILTFFLIFTLLNGIITHTNLLIMSFNNNLYSSSLLISICGPWIMSLLLIVNGTIFLNILNWSSIFIFGYVNYILPLLLYVEALNEAEIFELNYKQSALIDFENFIYLKKQEIIYEEEKVNDDNLHDIENVPLITDNNCILMFNINNIIKQLEVKLHKQRELDEDTKEKIVDLFYEMEGYYSINKSYQILFGKLISDKSKVSIIFYITIITLIMFMFFSIYFALYNFFINKTLVVNIFLQTK